MEFGHNLVKTAFACIVHTEFIVDFLSAVKGEDHVAHFTVCKIDDVIVNEHAVGGEGKAEVFACFLFSFAGISHKVFDYVKIHKRLTAEEVNFKVVTSARIFNEEIKGAFANFFTHNRSFTRIFALTCKTICAVKVAGVRHVQTQCLYNTRSLFLQLV